MEREQIQIIAVDFDGTLCADCYPQIGEPNIALIQRLKYQQKRGRKIILWTCHCEERLVEAVEWCSRLGLNFDAVNANVAETIERYGKDPRKISADIYIDDRAWSPERTSLQKK